MGKIFQSYLSGTRVYACVTCGAHLANYEDIISTGFHGRHGDAYLFDSVVNVSLGPKEQRDLLTGRHIVADILCNVCQQVIGWKYLEAFESDQKYKENKYIIEKPKMTEEKGWLEIMAPVPRSTPNRLQVLGGSRTAHYSVA